MKNKNIKNKPKNGVDGFSCILDVPKICQVIHLVIIFIKLCLNFQFSNAPRIIEMVPGFENVESMDSIRAHCSSS